MMSSRWIPKWHKLFSLQLEEVVAFAGAKAPFEYRQLLRLISSVHTKRMMFDSRQAVVFDQSEPIRIQGAKIHAPFGSFWMEMTEPIEVQAQQPGYKDELVAILFIDDALDADVMRAGGRIQRLKLCQVVFVFYNHEKGQWVDRSWSISLEEKIAVTTQHTTERAGKWNECVDETSAFLIKGGFSVRAGGPIVQQAQQDDSTRMFEAGIEIPGRESREVTWWENAIKDYTDMVLWMLAYCMCKSVRVEQMKMPRQQIRAAQRAGQIPHPWHRVFVEPKIAEQLPVEGEPGPGVGYRFDVIGHLRFNRHKLASGAYRHTVEWVPDHQRGLQNDIYIPKTYAVAKGNRPLPENQEYFTGEPKLGGTEK